MEFDVKREMATSFDGAELTEMYESDARQGKFWFRLHVNGCPNVDKLYQHLLEIGLLDFQARQACVDFGEYTNNEGEKISEFFGMREGEVMSFMVTASSDEELEEKMSFFVEGVKRIKEAVTDCLLHKIPEWATEGKRITI